jgi:hypothetical protein
MQGVICWTCRDKLKANKKKLFDHLDAFLAPDHLEYPLPKPRTIAKAHGINIHRVYFDYYTWRTLHHDDYRVKAHRKKYTGEW